MGIERERASDQNIQATWAEEIEQRLSEIAAGTVELIQWEEMRHELFAPPVTTKSRHG